jgi:hypothetical protein
MFNSIGAGSYAECAILSGDCTVDITYQKAYWFVALFGIKRTAVPPSATNLL